MAAHKHKHTIFTRKFRDSIQTKCKTRTYFIVANLFKTLCSKFYPNRPTFIENITKTFRFTFYYAAVMGFPQNNGNEVSQGSV